MGETKVPTSLLAVALALVWGASGALGRANSARAG